MLRLFLYGAIVYLSINTVQESLALNRLFSEFDTNKLSMVFTHALNIAMSMFWTLLAVIALIWAETIELNHKLTLLTEQGEFDAG